jgi:uncharacterized Zn finger protein (UPF0148 family)
MRSFDPMTIPNEVWLHKLHCVMCGIPLVLPFNTPLGFYCPACLKKLEATLRQIKEEAEQKAKEL